MAFSQEQTFCQHLNFDIVGEISVSRFFHSHSLSGPNSVTTAITSALSTASSICLFSNNSHYCLVISQQRPNNEVMDMLNTNSSLKDHFLIAMPALNDGIFANSITYICEHNEQGAMGIVINHPLDLSLDEIFHHLEIEDINSVHRDQILAGGPVHMNRGFILHRRTEDQWDSTIHISDQIALTTSQDILNAIAHDNGPSDSLVALGYAGWEGGQLEHELAENAWLTLPADSNIIFNTPVEQRASAAVAKIGVDLALISPLAGHA